MHNGQSKIVADQLTIEKEKDNNKIQELSEMFGGTDRDGVDEGDGSFDELDAVSVGSVPCRSGHLHRAPDRYSPCKLGGLAADKNLDLEYSFIANPTTVLVAYYSKFQHLVYDLVVGMLLYLAENTRPDIAFAVHQCVWYSHRPKKCHDE